jgi:hypothetical protein
MDFCLTQVHPSLALDLMVISQMKTMIRTRRVAVMMVRQVMKIAMEIKRIIIRALWKQIVLLFIKLLHAAGRLQKRKEVTTRIRKSMLARHQLQQQYPTRYIL